MEILKPTSIKFPTDLRKKIEDEMEKEDIKFSKVVVTRLKKSFKLPPFDKKVK